MTKTNTRLLSALVIEASLSMAYDTWIGPTYLSTWAGTLGVSPDRLAWLTSLPTLGSLGQFLGVFMLLKLWKNIPLKRLCIALTLFARCLWLLPLILSGTHWISGNDPNQWASQVGILAAVSSAIGLTSASFWVAWMRELVPAREEGRFWGGRNRWATVGIISAHLISGFWLKTQPGASAFQLLLILALLSAAGSIWLLWRTPASLSHHSSGAKTPGAFQFKRLLQPDLREILIFGALLQGSMLLAGPYFPYYFTQRVGLSGSHIAFWSLMTQAGAWLSCHYWGRKMDEQNGVAWQFLGKPVSILQVCTFVIALSPLPYLISDPAVLRWIGPAEYFINGVAWSGFTIALNTLIFQRTQSSPQLSMSLFSTLTAAQGLLGALASWAGSIILTQLPMTGFITLWISATFLRLGVAFFFCPKLTQTQPIIEDIWDSNPEKPARLASELQ